MNNLMEHIEKINEEAVMHWLEETNFVDELIMHIFERYNW